MGNRHRDAGKIGTTGIEGALHRPAYWTDTDPAAQLGTGEDGVEAGQWWLEHSSGAPDTLVAIKLRNDANDGWITLFALTDHEHDGGDTQLEIKAESGGTYTLVLADAGKWINLTNGSQCIVTLPPNSSVAWPVGKSVIMRQGSTGPVVIQGGGGVTVHTEGGKDQTKNQHAVVAATKIATDTWALFGNLEASS